MTCERFEDWLDEGMPEAEAGLAARHSKECRACAALMQSAHIIERELAGLRPVAPAGFTDRVMARVATATHDPAKASLPVRDAFPWWARAAAEPAAAAALIVGALILWQGPAILAGALALTSWMGHQLAQFIASPPGSMNPDAWRPMLLALALAIAPLAAWMALTGYRWSERTIGHAAAGFSLRRRLR